MDGGTFDQLTRLLAGRLSRRMGLAGTLAGLASGGSGPALELAARPRRGQDRPQRAAEDRDGEVFDEKRPCGPKPKDNRCNTHGDCCTNYCRPPKGNARIGRCRCIKPGKKCKGKRKCCGGAVCLNKRCTIASGSCGAVGAPCAAQSSCCSGLICAAGACASCPTATVCASGCPFTDVNAAYAAAAAGSTIVIAPGAYPTGIVVSKNITLEGCPGLAAPTLTPNGMTNADDTYTVMIAESGTDATAYTVTLRNLALKGTGIDNGEALLYGNAKGRVTYKLDACRVSDAGYGVYASSGDHTIDNSSFANLNYAMYLDCDTDNPLAYSATVTNSTFTGIVDYAFQMQENGPPWCPTARLVFTGCTFTDNLESCVSLYGDVDHPDKYTLTATNTTFTGTNSNQAIDLTGIAAEFIGCTISDTTGMGINVLNGDLKLTNTLVTRNVNSGANSGSLGGGVFFHSQYKPPTRKFEMAGTSLITQNSATSGGGVYMLADVAPQIIGTTTSNITGNTATTGANCALSTGGPTTSVSCQNWT